MTVPDRPNSPAGAPWGPVARAAASLGLVWHVVAIMIAPISTPPRFEGPPSVLGTTLGRVYRPYITAMFLDHAYKFFAPNPGDSHLIRYDLYFADGTKKIHQEDQIFPDRTRHWPRLLYHRHFMLTEFINDGRPFDFWNTEELGPGGGAPAALGPTPPLGPTPAPLMRPATPEATASSSGELVAPRSDGPPYSMSYARAFAAYLARKHDAVRVDLYYRIHRLSSPEAIRAGRKLDEPDTYRDRLLVTYRREVKS